ncbi:hypothetical protein LTR74_015178 [Friedmanniomyces endolithicus]|nr:hypothetical protein LTR74_015178 [Friedmanniomyces endolithicus]
MGSCLAGAYSQRVFTHGKPCQPFDAIFSSAQRVTIAPTRQTGLHLVNWQLYDEVREECVALPAQRLPDRHIYNFNDYPHDGGRSFFEALNKTKSGAGTDLVFWQPVPSYNTLPPLGSSPTTKVHIITYSEDPYAFLPVSLLPGWRGGARASDFSNVHFLLVQPFLVFDDDEPLVPPQIFQVKRLHPPDREPTVEAVCVLAASHIGAILSEPSMHHRAVVAQRSLQPGTEAITRREADLLARELGWTGPTRWQMRLRVAVLWWRRVIGRRAIAMVQPDAEAIARLKAEPMSRQLGGSRATGWQVRLRMAVLWWWREGQAIAFLHTVLLIVAIGVLHRVSDGEEVGKR